MKEGKHARDKFKIIEVYSVLILIATLFMGIGYAEITGDVLKIEGETTAVAQEGVFITNITYVPSSEGETTASKINYFLGTMFDSQIVLGDTSASTVTYEVTLYNNLDKDYVFIGVLTDTEEENIYSNKDIIYTLSEVMKEYQTIIPANSELKFTITFGYASGITISNNTLKSKLNFRFQELPILELSNDGQTYELDNIYPDFEPKEYEFTVSNFNDSKTNGVPMSYIFETTIDKPLTAKIYDKNGNEVKDPITIDGDGTTQTEHKYTLKILWDDSNTEENIEYDSLDYINKEFSCKVNLKATPDSDKYLDYEIAKGFDVNIKTASFYFETEVEKSYVVLANNAGNYKIKVKNNNSSEYSTVQTEYEIILEGNDKLTFSIDGVDATQNKISKTINGGSIIDETITLNVKNISNTELNPTETATIKVKSKSPYIKEYSFPITIRTRVASTVELKGAFIDYNVGYTDAYTGYTYTNSNGWRIVDYTRNSDGTLSNVKLISTGIPAKLSYLYTETQNITTWIETDSNKLTAYKNMLQQHGEYILADTEVTSYYALKVAAGMYNNFEKIKFAYSASDRGGNLGHFTQITTNGTTYGSGNTTEVTGGQLFNLYGSNANVRLLTLPELNMSIGRSDIDSVEDIAESEDTIGLHRLTELVNVSGMSSYSYSSQSYWLASPFPGTGYGISVLYVENVQGFDDEFRKALGARPVICINPSDVEIVKTNSETVFEILF